MDNKYIPKEEWAKVAYYQNGNGIKYPFFDSMYSYYNHYEYRKNLIPEEMKELLFKTGDDEKWLMPTSDDFKIEWVDIPEVVKLKGYTSGYDELGFAIYGGIIGGSDSETMPCRFVKVTSYNARKEEISVKERLSFSCQEDCFYNVSTGDHLLYFLDYTGKNEIPDDYSPEELITYINDVIQLESIRNDPDSKVERIDCSYYYSHEYDGYSGLQAYDLESIFVLDIDSKVLSYRSESEGVVPFDTQYGCLVYDDYGYSGIKSGMCEGKSFYSDPQKHICKYYIGDGSEFTSVPEEMYNNGFIGYEKDNDYLSPASSDYIYCWDRDPWSYGNDFVTLISFDDKGNLIQFVKRGYKPENMVNSVSELIEGDSLEGSTTLYFDDSYYYIDILNYPYYKEQNKMSILFLMFNGEDFGRLNVLSEAASDNYRAYINEPGFSSSNSAVENTVILEDNLFDGLTMLSDNYLCLYHPDVEILGTKDGKKYNDSFIVDEYVVLFFDEKGYQIEGHNRFVDVFSSEKEAKEYYDEISTYLPGWEPEISGNAVATNGEAGTETKYYYLMHADDEDFEYEFYFSKPYLTDSENAHLMRNTYNY